MPDRPLLECVINVSEGREAAVLDAISAAGSKCVLDRHSDADHQRSVFTVAGEAETVSAAARSIARAVVTLVPLAGHEGPHPRIGSLDVVPFVSLRSDGNRVADGDLTLAIRERNAFANWASAELDLPCFLYGPERSLPEVRRSAWASARPDAGPPFPHPRAGAVAVGARPLLVAYNVWLAVPDLAMARRVAAELRGPDVCTLAFALGDGVQVSFNLIAPARVGPAEAYDAVAALAPIQGAELVGLVPGFVLDAVPEERWASLDLGRDRTIEARLAERS